VGQARPVSGSVSSEANDGVISPKQVAQFSALLWAIAAAIGLLVILLPHGHGVVLAGWIGLTAFAVLVALWMAWIGERQPEWANYVLSVAAVFAASAAVGSARHDPLGYALCGLYLLPTIFAASFYDRPAFLAYLVVQAGLSAAVLFTSGLPGAPGAWVAVVGTTSTVGLVVHVLQRALKVAATTDPLTGLVNRRAFEPVLRRELSRCERLGHPLTLVVLDLDNFKSVNDDLGHEEGDRALMEVTKAWSKELRLSDVLARAGGDEFALLLPSTGWRPAMDVLARLSRSSSQRFSAGVAVAEPGSSVKDVTRRADDACYEAKHMGGGQVVVAGAPNTGLRLTSAG